jgi:hypothetical protein
MTTDKKDMVWEGRGDKLTDARATMFAAAAADDLRLSATHLRILTYLGRQNERRGWLRVSQKDLAATWGVSRQRVNTAVGELIRFGYVAMQSQAESGESFCLYKVLLDTDIVVPPNSRADDTATGSADEGDTPLEGGVSRPGDTPLEGGVSRPGDTPPGGECPAQATPVSRPGDTCVTIMDTKRTEYAEYAVKTPTHSLRKPQQPVGNVCAGDELFSALKSGDDGEAGAHVVDEFIRPLWGVLKLATGAADPMPFLAAIRDELASTGPTALRAAFKVARSTRSNWPSPAQARAIVTEAAKTLPMQKFEQGSIGYNQWMQHYRDNGMGYSIKMAEQQGYVSTVEAVPPMARAKSGRAA